MDHHRLHPTCPPWPESDSAGLSAVASVSGCPSPWKHPRAGPPPPPARAAHHWHRWTAYSLDIAGISQTSPPRQAGLRSPPPHRTPVATAPPRAPFASPPGVSCCERSEGFCHQARAPTVLHLCTVIPLATRCMCMAHRTASRAVRQFRSKVCRSMRSLPVAGSSAGSLALASSLLASILWELAASLSDSESDGCAFTHLVMLACL